MNPQVNVTSRGFEYVGLSESQLEEAWELFDDLAIDQSISFRDAVAGMFDYWRGQGYTINDPLNFEAEVEERGQLVLGLPF